MVGIFCDIAENEYNISRAVIASLIKLQLEQNKQGRNKDAEDKYQT